MLHAERGLFVWLIASDEPELAGPVQQGAEEVFQLAFAIEQSYVQVLEDFLAAVEGERPARTPVEDGLAAVRIADAIKTSAARGLRVETVDR